MARTQVHRRRKWGWVVFGVLGLIDYAIRGDISQLWKVPIAGSIPVVFALSVYALSVGEGAAEEAAD